MPKLFLLGLWAIFTAFVFRKNICNRGNKTTSAMSTDECCAEKYECFLFTKLFLKKGMTYIVPDYY
jgi:hypothetical protein